MHLLLDRRLQPQPGELRMFRLPRLNRSGQVRPAELEPARGAL